MNEAKEIYNKIDDFYEDYCNDDGTMSEEFSVYDFKEWLKNKYGVKDD